MSSKAWAFRIRDMLNSINKIEKYVENITLAQFKKNELVVDAVIRNFEIMGEASKHIPVSVHRMYPTVPWNQIKGMRNILIHEYFGVDVETVWYTVKHHLPDLKKELEDILHKSSD